MQLFERSVLEVAFVLGLWVLLAALYGYNGLKTINHELTVPQDFALLLGKTMVVYAAGRLIMTAGQTAWERLCQRATPRQQSAAVAFLAVTVAANAAYFLGSDTWTNLKRYPLFEWMEQTFQERAARDFWFCVRLTVLLMLFHAVLYMVWCAFVINWRVFKSLFLSASRELSGSAVEQDTDDSKQEQPQQIHSNSPQQQLKSAQKADVVTVDDDSQ